MALEPSRKYLTTFFSDVRGFTAAAERMDPGQLVHEMNDYFSAMTEIVFKHGGTLDKYVGDAVMVFFGDPIPQEDHAARAVRMGIEMLERMKTLSDHWQQQYGEVFEIGIGISTGWVTVGDLGSPARSDYTVLGDQVNVASRLADRAEARRILVTEETMTAVEGIVEGRLVGEVRLKGITRQVKVYELIVPEYGDSAERTPEVAERGPVPPQQATFVDHPDVLEHERARWITPRAVPQPQLPPRGVERPFGAARTAVVQMEQPAAHRLPRVPAEPREVIDEEVAVAAGEQDRSRRGPQMLTVGHRVGRAATSGHRARRGEHARHHDDRDQSDDPSTHGPKLRPARGPGKRPNGRCCRYPWRPWRPTSTSALRVSTRSRNGAR